MLKEVNNDKKVNHLKLPDNCCALYLEYKANKHRITFKHKNMRVNVVC